jgi:hypothetical protein
VLRLIFSWTCRLPALVAQNLRLRMHNPLRTLPNGVSTATVASLIFCNIDRAPYSEVVTVKHDSPFPRRLLPKHNHLYVYVIAFFELWAGLLGTAYGRLLCGSERDLLERSLFFPQQLYLHMKVSRMDIWRLWRLWSTRYSPRPTTEAWSQSTVITRRAMSRQIGKVSLDGNR